MAILRTSRQSTLAKDNGLTLSHELFLMATAIIHVTSHLNRKHSGTLDRNLRELCFPERPAAASFELLHYLYFNFKVVEQLCDLMGSNVDRGGVLNSYFRLVGCALLRPGGTQLKGGFCSSAECHHMWAA
ncbi:hypothetical protein GQ42DRAFT_156675 [Ramicandelaber brevisporus]|nr:hypothetical protein GQ42DRAFT_156675 [Ramicandelaber brevisporus]